MTANTHDTDSAIKAFDKQSIVFDEIYSVNEIIQYKRNRTRNELEQHLPKGAHILELNAGTGEDAVYFAQKGYKVHATDMSAGMLMQLTKKVRELHLTNLVTSQNLSYLELDKLSEQEPFDAIFSNFGGLNCTEQLDTALNAFGKLLKPGGVVTLVIMPPFCLWETLMTFRGRFKLAFRRFFAKKGAKAQIEDVKFLCWYYKPSYVIDHMKTTFELLDLKGLCTIVPPSYLESLPKKLPGLYRFLTKLEDKYSNTIPFAYIGDYYIISFKKKTLKQN